MNVFLKKYYQLLILGAIFIFVIVFCLSNLTTKPKLWSDEGTNIEIAHNFLLFQKLDNSTAPGVFSGVSFILGSNGYPLTVPLAGFFHFFDFGLGQARIYMLLWMIISLAGIYYVVKSIFGRTSALVSVALVATFATFYGSGLTVTGEIPGFVFLLCGLFFLVKKENYLFSGLFFGLAAVTKPSNYLILLPACFIYVLFLKKDVITRWANLTLGLITPVLLNVYLLVPNSFFSTAGWITLLRYYQNPFGGSSSLLTIIYTNLCKIPFHSTLIYFALLIFVIIFSFFRNKDLSSIQRRIFLFFFIYGSFVFLYFLKSPGWLRYLLPLQLLVFVLIFPSVLLIVKRFRLSTHLAVIFVTVLIIVQGFHLFYGSNLYASDTPQKVASFVNEQPEATVGLFDLPQVAAFISHDRRYHVIKTMPMPQIGENPLSFSQESLLDMIVFKKGGKGENFFVAPYQDVLEENYTLINQIGAYQIFQRN